MRLRFALAPLIITLALSGCGRSSLITDEEQYRLVPERLDTVRGDVAALSRPDGPTVLGSGPLELRCVDEYGDVFGPQADMTWQGAVDDVARMLQRANWTEAAPDGEARNFWREYPGGWTAQVAVVAGKGPRQSVAIAILEPDGCSAYEQSR